MKLFNNVELPVQLYIQFTPGGVDFVGGYTYYNFLKNNFGADGTPKSGQQLGKVTLAETSGEEIHKKVFEDGSMQTPVHWKQIIAYF